jgi:hypothetical protein
MKRTLLLTLFLTLFLCLLFFGSQPSEAGGQNQAGGINPSSTASQQPDALITPEQKPDIVIGSARRTVGPADMDEEETDPDLPKGRRGNINEGAYLRLRDEYIGRLRGVEPGHPFDPGARGRAIRQMEEVQALRTERTKSSFFNKLASIIGSETPLAPIWTELGPRPLPNGSGQGGLIVPVSGRVTSIAIDPSNSNKVYLGTAQGGVWRSLDAGVNWTPIFDGAESLAIGALAIAPLSPSTLYVGTGEFNGCGDCFFGVGLYRIDNADTSATLVGPINPSQTIGNLTYKVFNGRGITKILVDPNNAGTIFVSTGRGIGGQGANALSTLPNVGILAPRGLFRSTNATGSAASISFQRLTVTTDNSVLGETPATGNVDTTDMVMEPGNPNNILVSVIGLNGTNGGIYRSTNALAPTPSFSQTLALPLLPNGQSPRVGLAINKVGSTVTAYAATGETPTVTTACATTFSGALHKSFDGGASWSGQLAGGQGFCGGQCFYNLTVAVDPNNANLIYLGGNARGISSGIQCSDAMKKSTDGGTSFTRDDSGLHADSHALLFDPLTSPATIYTGNDGGIWKGLSNANPNTSTSWTNLNTSPLSTLQFESIAVHPLDQFFTIGGTQDNGTEVQQTSSGNWINAEGGDGGYTLIDQNAANTTNVTMYLTFFNESNSQIFFDRATLTSCLDVRNSWPSRGAIACGNAPCPDRGPAPDCDHLPFLLNNGIQLTDNVLFYAPMALGPGNPNTLYFGTDRLYRSTDRGDHMTIVSQSPLQPTTTRCPLGKSCPPAGSDTPASVGTPISTIAISPQDDNYRLIGMQNGQVWATSTGSPTMVNITGSFPANPNLSPTNAFVGRAIIDPNNKDVAYISFSFFAPAGQGIWKITNLGAAGSGGAAPNWVPAASGIPSIPINALAVDPINSNNVFAGTDIGVYNSTDGGATWNPFGTGLPRVAVFGMAIQPSSRILRVATHGRGMWQISLNATPGPNTVQFTNSGTSASETLNQTTKVNIAVTRAGDTSGTATIDYATSDGTASERSDYEAAFGTLRFGANEATKTITVFIIDDRFLEGPETFNVNLTNPIGCTLGSPAIFTVTIISNDATNLPNPVKDASFDTDFFVRQQYLDFLNREADPSGLAFWKNEIDSCTTQQCREIKRINVSAAFFLSIEFQQTGYLVYRTNQAAFDTQEFLRLRDFLPDTQEIGRGVIIGQPGADQLLEQNKQRFFSDFVQRAAFLAPAAYPTSLTAAQFVDKLNANTYDPRNSGSGPALTPTERDALVAQLSSNPSSPTLRAQVLRSIAENSLFSNRQSNKAFVLMQYFGYLRRNPNDPPEIALDYSGYNFWLKKLNDFNGNFVDAEMVKAFIVSGEYQGRFGP